MKLLPTTKLLKNKNFILNLDGPEAHYSFNKKKLQNFDYFQLI